MLLAYFCGLALVIVQCVGHDFTLTTKHTTLSVDKHRSSLFLGPDAYPRYGNRSISFVFHEFSEKNKVRKDSVGVQQGHTISNMRRTKFSTVENFTDAFTDGVKFAFKIPNVNATVNMVVSIWKKDDHAMIGDERVAMKPGDAKVEMTISDWKLCARSEGVCGTNYWDSGVYVDVVLGFRGPLKQFPARIPNLRTKSAREFYLGDGAVIALPTKKVLDGNVVSFESQYPRREPGGRIRLHFKMTRTTSYSFLMQPASMTLPKAAPILGGHAPLTAHVSLIFAALITYIYAFLF